MPPPTRASGSLDRAAVKVTSSPWRVRVALVPQHGVRRAVVELVGPEIDPGAHQPRVAVDVEGREAPVVGAVQQRRVGPEVQEGIGEQASVGRERRAAHAHGPVAHALGGVGAHEGQRGAAAAPPPPRARARLVPWTIESRRSRRCCRAAGWRRWRRPAPRRRPARPWRCDARRRPGRRSGRSRRWRRAAPLHRSRPSARCCRAPGGEGRRSRRPRRTRPRWRRARSRRPPRAGAGCSPARGPRSRARACCRRTRSRSVTREPVIVIPGSPPLPVIPTKDCGPDARDRQVVGAAA